MPFGLPSMNRVKSGSYVVRKAIPADVRDECERRYAQRWEVKSRSPAALRPQEAKAKQAEFLASAERRFQAIPDANAGRARSLSEREALALAGERKTPAARNDGRNWNGRLMPCLQRERIGRKAMTKTLRLS